MVVFSCALQVALASSAEIQARVREADDPTSSQILYCNRIGNIREAAPNRLEQVKKRARQNF
jgi:hypothetical protein